MFKIKQVSVSLLLSLAVVLPVCAESVQPCHDFITNDGKDFDYLLQLPSSINLSDYDKMETMLSGESSEGETFEYYYTTEGDLKAVKYSYYGETGKTEVDYYFYSPSTYISNLTNYYYTVPIAYDDDLFALASDLPPKG